MTSPKAPTLEAFNEEQLIAEENKLKGEIEELKRRLDETNNRKVEAEKRRTERNERRQIDEIVLDVEEEEKEEEEEEEVAKQAKRGRLDPVETKKMVEKTLNEKWEGQELVTIDPRAAGFKEAPKGTDSRGWEDAIRLQREGKEKKDGENFCRRKRRWIK
ncbi:hypothetical protein niasHT_028893 [Heterodera trifolii]|uniref:Uncharacterized protein n=1 Tax=Heterodera trifolii TaxID=157864 RepID=A0ABD2KIX5_9BILA